MRPAMSLRRIAFVLIGVLVAACAPMPVPTAVIPTPVTPPPLVITPQTVIVAPPLATATARPTASPVASTAALPVASPTASPTTQSTSAPSETPERNHPVRPTPTPISFFEQQVTNLFDLAQLPVMENTTTTQFTSRNWVALEHYFDYFIDDGNFFGPNYGYLDENGQRHPYRIVTGYDGVPEYEIVPRVQGPGAIERIWFAYQQHQSLNNPKDMSQNDEWSNWGDLGAMGNIRFYFDDEATPRMDTGIKEIFVGKNPFPAPLSAFYASADGGNITYVPIPFARSIRVTTTGRPRLMQIQVKRFSTPVESFTPNLTASEQTALDEARQAWQTCTARVASDYQSFALSIPHNQSAEVDFNNPAMIAGMRVHIPDGMEDSVWMQVFWDGDYVPSMIAPLRAMFGTAEQLFPYRALPLGTLSQGQELVFYNNFPMPFRSARIVFVNDRAETLPLTLEIALREITPGAENTRLHAYYGTQRMQRREGDGDNYPLIDVQGSGKYLGTIFSAWDLDRGALNGPLDPNWRFPYLESNMDVWVDGKLALAGTGIEDDFNAGYYYVFAGYEGYNAKYCLAGVTLLDYSTRKEPSSQYRFYLNDAPEFREHLRVEAEHGNKGNNLSVTYSSTAFWYQLH